MSCPTDPRAPRIERFLHRPYETVRSADLDGQEAAQEALRAWHNRALHSTFGVVFGLDVDLAGPDPQPGAFRATVAPGLAYDAAGRDLLLRTPVTIKLPIAPRGMTLVLRWGEPGPTLAWFPTQGLSIARGVPVARTVATPPIEGAGLKSGSSLPPDLKGTKVDFDADQHTLTIRGLLSQAQYQALRAVVDDATAAKLEAAFFAWPFEAPRQSGAIRGGLDVDIDQGTDGEATLWTAVVTPGSAINAQGRVLTIPDKQRVPLDFKADRRTVVIRPEGQGAKVDVVADPLSLQNPGAVELARLSPPADPVIPLDAPVDERSATARGLLQGLLQAGKIAYDPAAPAITLAGFLTRQEADQLVDMVSDNPISVVNAHGKLRTDVEANRPTRTRDAPGAERAPLFPPRSRPLARPRIASGSTLPGRTEWKKAPGDLVAYEATVTIESAGFTEVPQLLAWVERLFLSPQDPDSTLQPPVPRPLPFLGGIRDRGFQGPSRTPEDGPDPDLPSTRSFVFRVWSDLNEAQLQARLMLIANENTIVDWLRDHLYVRWLGVQTDPLPDWETWPATAGD